MLVEIVGIEPLETGGYRVELRSNDEAGTLATVPMTREQIESWVEFFSAITNSGHEKVKAPTGIYERSDNYSLRKSYHDWKDRIAALPWR
jgi:hypothetical protein